MAISRNPGEFHERFSRQQFQETAAGVMDKAKDIASSVGQKAEDATHAIGNRLKTLASTVRHQAPNEGVMGSAASSLASGIENSGAYLETKGLKGLADDVTDLIRKNPMPALLVGLGLGFLLARTTIRR